MESDPQSRPPQAPPQPSDVREARFPLLAPTQSHLAIQIGARVMSETFQNINFSQLPSYGEAAPGDQDPAEALTQEHRSTAAEEDKTGELVFNFDLQIPDGPEALQVISQGESEEADRELLRNYQGVVHGTDFDREILRQAGISTMNKFIDMLEKANKGQRKKQIEDALAKIQEADPITFQIVSGEDLTPEKLVKNAELFKQVVDKYPEINDLLKRIESKKPEFLLSDELTTETIEGNPDLFKKIADEYPEIQGFLKKIEADNPNLFPKATLTLEKIERNPALLHKIVDEFPEFIDLYNAPSPADIFVQNINNDSLGTGVDPHNLRNDPKGRDARAARYWKRLEEARSNPDGSGPVNTGGPLSPVEAALTGGVPSVFPDGDEQREMNRIGDLRQKKVEAAVEASRSYQWFGGNPYTSGLKHLASTERIDPIRDQEGLISADALEANAESLYDGPGKNAFGQYIMHTLGGEKRRRNTLKTEEAIKSYLDTDPHRFPTDSKVQTRLVDEAHKRFLRNRQKIRDIDEEIAEDGSTRRARIKRRGSRYVRRVKRRLLT